MTEIMIELRAKPKLQYNDEKSQIMRPGLCTMPID